jgi:HSP20 family protein
MVSPFGPVRGEFEELVNRFLGPWAIPDEFFRATPYWEVTEAEKEVVYRMALAGFEANEVELSIVGNELTLHAEHRAPERAPATREAAPFERIELTETLPAGLEPEHMTATFRNGLLEVHVPRVPAAVPRRIEVTT